MRFSINIPNFGDFADPGTVAAVASAAEQAGWDGLFVWITCLTEAIRVPLVTPGCC